MVGQRRLFLFFLVAYVSFLSSAVAQGISAAERNRATFVLGGKVQKVELVGGVQVATVQVTASPRTPPAIGSLVDQEVRIITKNGSGSLHTGSSYTFYAVGTSGAAKVTVREIGRVSGVAQTFQFTALQPSIALRYSNADAVVRAQVTVQTDVPSLSAESSAEPPPPSEHDPKYQTWTLNIEDVLKGRISAKSISVLVATNPDIAYAGIGDTTTPTTSGETRVFALRWDPQLKSFIATDQIDVRPLSEMPAIEMTVKPVQGAKSKK